MPLGGGRLVHESPDRVPALLYSSRETVEQRTAQTPRSLPHRNDARDQCDVLQLDEGKYRPFVGEKTGGCMRLTFVEHRLPTIGDMLASTPDSLLVGHVQSWPRIFVWSVPAPAEYGRPGFRIHAHPSVGRFHPNLVDASGRDVSIE